MMGKGFVELVAMPVAPLSGGLVDALYQTG